MQASYFNGFRKLYQQLIPEKYRSRLTKNPVIQGFRETVNNEEESMPYVLLQEKHIANLKVVLNRNALLGQLPKNGIAAEIGVNRGDFSERIFTLAQPAELHLVDIWETERYHDGLRHHV